MRGDAGAPGFLALVAAAAPLWAGEAAVFDRYFAAAERTATSDLQWIERQCYKELVDGVEPRLRALAAALDGLGGPGAMAEACAEAEELREEYEHLRAFADARAAIAGPGAAPLDAGRLRSEGNWPENAALGAARARHREADGELGALAQAFTEGGCCTLYAAGMSRHETAADRAIAAACGAVYADEVDHMRAGTGGLVDLELEPERWTILQEMVIEQLRLRIAMRNAQFGGLVPVDEVVHLMSGALPARADTLARVGVDPALLRA